MTGSPGVKVLFVSNTAQWVGPNVSLVNLISHLPGRYRNSAEVVYPGRGPLESRLNKLGVVGHSFRSLNKFSILRLWKLMRRSEADLVYGNSTSGSSRNALVAAKAARLPFVYHLREMAGHAGLRKTLSLKYADAVIAVSVATADSYERYCRRAPIVVYNGVELQSFAHDRFASRQRLLRLIDAPSEAVRNIVVHVGNMYARKGQLDAVSVFSSLAAEMPGSYLLLFGITDRDTVYLARVRDRIDELGLVSNVVIAGLREDLPEMLPGADLFLHTAIQDPHPRSVIEAMASGLPVVAYATDGVRETVSDEVTGFLAEIGDVEALGDAARRVLGSPSIRDRFAKAARREVADRFTAARTAEGVVSVLDKVLS